MLGVGGKEDRELGRRGVKEIFLSCPSRACAPFPPIWPSVISSILHVVVLLLKNSKGLSFNPGCLVAMWQSSFEGFVASLDSR